MARKIWVVIVDDGDTSESQRVRGQYDFTKTSKYGVFYNNTRANEAARVYATENPGKEVYVLGTEHGFYTPPATKIVLKHWTDEGEYVTT